MHLLILCSLAIQGFLTCVEALRPSCGAVLDVTIAYKRRGMGLVRPPAPSMFGEFLLGLFLQGPLV